ncbi:pseudouridylate synthase TRUB1 isoform X1 [Rhipicephalus sanguineus]|uniref:pseudouridylate synthase TRUB1 isoform X1 n=1 Tax=Rhipicephalus sanguineus TaxID=34632 RepID=UPI0018939E4B|nr:pseudouridylate synthase TRUB1 isoform X1 [Rhipicephalus sanguineus]
MSASSLVCKRLLPKDARKLLRAVFPVLKEKDEDVRDITEKLKLVFNHDLDIRLNAYGINVSPIGHLETSARGVIAYNVGTGDGISRWLRLSNRKFLVKGYFGVETCTYNSLGRVVGTAPYDHITEEKLMQVFPQFLGEIKQAVNPPEAPPHDADKVAKRDHVAIMEHLAVCHSIRCSELCLPHFSLEIVCGPGFSPRVFVHDLGKALGSCAHVMHMELTQYGPFTLEHALPSYRWSWEEAKATSEKLHTLWYTHVGDVRNEMKGTADRFKNVARYF